MSTDVVIAARDGYPLAATLFEAVGDRKGVVLVNSATAVKRTFYAKFAAWLAGQGYDVVTRSAGLRPWETARAVVGALAP